MANPPKDGTDHFNYFYGTELSDTFTGLNGSDVMYGGDGSDRFYGGNGKDTLTGGTGQDFLYGGTGNDTFVYNSGAEAGTGTTADVIGDFKSGQDKLDFHAFMAGGSFLGAADFTAGEGPAVRYDKAAGVLYGDVNGDGVADFSITIANHAAMAAGDFIF